MIHENEVLVLLLGMGVLAFILSNCSRLKYIQASKVLIAGFYVLLVGWILTILEGFFWQEYTNIFEHMCYAASSILICTWCGKIFRKERNR